jgi:cyclase
MTRLARLGISLGMLALAAASPGQSSRVGTVQKVADGIWTVTTDQSSNASWFTLGDEVVAIDAGGDPATGKAILEKIQETAGKPVRFVIVTHSHGDHAGGLAPFEAAGAKVICQENNAAALAALIDPAARARSGLLALSERLLLLSGSRRAAIYYLGPAHTNGDLVVYLPEEKVLFSGDVALVGRAPYMQSPDVDPKGWETVIGRLAQLDVTKVVPGHGNIGTRESLAETYGYVKRVNEVAARMASEDVPEDLLDARLHQPDLGLQSGAVTPDFIGNVRAALRALQGRSAKTPTPAAPRPTPTKAPAKSKK